MPRGGIRPRRIDGSTDHLLKPKWKSGQTRTIRVPVVLAKQLLDIAHKLDSGESLELTQDNITELEQIKASQAKAIALLQNAITPRAKGGSYAANNATGIKRLVEQALALLAGDRNDFGLKILDFGLGISVCIQNNWVQEERIYPWKRKKICVEIRRSRKHKASISQEERIYPWG